MKTLASNLAFNWRYILRLLLAILAWSCGSAVGCFLFFRQRDVLVALMRGCIQAPVSIVGLLAVFTLPLLSAINLAIHIDSFVCCVFCFIKCMLLTLAVFSCRAVFQSGSWLAQGLVLFADFFSACIMICITLRHYVRQKQYTARDFVNLCAMVTAICIADYIFIQPLADAVLH